MFGPHMSVLQLRGRPRKQLRCLTLTKCSSLRTALRSFLRRLMPPWRVLLFLSTPFVIRTKPEASSTENKRQVVAITVWVKGTGRFHNSLVYYMLAVLIIIWQRLQNYNLKITGFWICIKRLKPIPNYFAYYYISLIYLCTKSRHLLLLAIVITKMISLLKTWYYKSIWIFPLIDQLREIVRLTSTLWDCLPYP